ncbi:MAG TPA: DsbA family protein [Acidimicrobiales bacterium]|nr:DsbA family protein [Acidimicrobiales bacterium]
MTTSFAVSWDYLCPFARNAHEHVLAALEAGADWDVRFVPFSLGEARVADGEPSIFEQADGRHYLYALAAGVTVRDEHPERFAAFHRAMFAARHEEKRDIRDDAVVAAVVAEQGLDAPAVAAKFEEAVAKIRDEHRASVADHAMFGVPTFVLGDRAVFVRLMDRPGGDPKKGLHAVEGVLRILEEIPTLNEFKYTKIAR